MRGSQTPYAYKTSSEVFLFGIVKIMEQYLELARSIAIEAGEIMKAYFLAVDREWKEDASPLTKADTEINELVIKRIRALYPDHSIHGEERSDYTNSSFVWVCDPVDGTLPFSCGIAASSFSIALIIDGISTIGVVFDPFFERMFHAVLGKGAYINNKPIQVSNQSTLDNAIIDIEGLYWPKIGVEVPLSNDLRDTLVDHGVKTTQLYSSILPSALVAQGQFTAVIMNGKTIQDGAAIKVIVDEAGGKVTDMYGNEQRYDEPARGFIASNGLVHDELVKIITDHSRK
jgi:fructose-1,6-bisphosphatase/inositol monophosphatase family enzyme